MLKLLIPKEVRDGETRVAASPDTVKQFVKLGCEVLIEAGAGASARIPDDDYLAQGAKLAGDGAWGEADLVAKVAPPTLEEVDRLGTKAILVAHAFPARHPDEVQALAKSGVTSLAMDLVPRVTRAQSMDALSSQATVGGYKASLLAATHLAKMCPLLMTAAGTVAPAKAVIFGAGVAGLQAIATCRRLGAIVEATDIRLAAKEQVESLGGRFIDVPGSEDMEDEGGYAKEVTPEFLAKQREEVAKRVADADIVITTAQVPGKKAPVLVSEEMVRSMRPGSVIVDMAVESGGNCALSKPGEIVDVDGVSIVGQVNLPTSVPLHASELYAKNVLNLLKLIVNKEGELAPDWEDEILAGCLLTKEGRIAHERTAEALGQSSSEEVSS